MNGSPASQSPDATLGRQHGPVKRRRPHRKTRTGCTECRRRRVKCDEQKPSCRACVRRAVPCRYAAEYRVITNATPDAARGLPLTPDTAVSPLSHHPSPYPPSASSPGQFTGTALTEATARPSPARPAIPGAFSIDDLALHHHWTLSTSLSICREPSCADIWQRMFPEVGFRHPFVTHAILSLAALHLAHGRGTGEEPYVAKAIEHHNEGLRGFRESVANITEANSEALFVWSMLNMIYVFGMFRRRDTASPRYSHKDLVLGVEWIPMIRGIEAVLYPTHEYLLSGRMSRILSLGNWFDLEPSPPAASAQGSDGYFCATRETWKNSSDAETYDEALRTLRRCRMFIEQFDTMDAATLAEWGYNRAWSGPLMFIHFAPHSYFTLLHQRQPPALVLFAYFGALLHGINDYWFMEGLGKEIVEVVDDLLGSYWRPWISWPLEYVGLA